MALGGMRSQDDRRKRVGCVPYLELLWGCCCVGAHCKGRVAFLSLQELQISAGFQELSLAERGGRRRDFHDLGVNTRQNLDHVKESKTGGLTEVTSSRGTVHGTGLQRFSGLEEESILLVAFPAPPHPSLSLPPQLLHVLAVCSAMFC